MNWIVLLLLLIAAALVMLYLNRGATCFGC
jgi:hypothetical protein